MCGICGLIDNASGAISRDKIQAMTDKMTHRGPDNRGIYINLESSPKVGLGHRRLSIIDLSSQGTQPMANEDESIRLVLNGEIYNYKTLREELKNKGHIFRSNTDAEVAVHLYEEHKEECVKYLRGMFAFAIWDQKKRTLFIARDRAGQKPLLYYHKDRRFVFASEFTSILESGLIEKKISYEAMHHYLTFGYIPAPLTIYEDIFKLPPAHTLTLEDEKATLRRYWNLDYSAKIKISEEDAATEVMRYLKDAVNIRLYSDVPL
ncbi:MAG: asparagine synthase (glutamine-hydrolyzing) [Candidatus Omnitrophota bacterium]